MILTLLSSVLILFTLLGFGKAVTSFFGTLFQGISGTILNGILAISLIWTCLSFFIPLNIYVETITVISGIFWFFKDKLYLKILYFTKKDALLVTVSALIILFCSSYYPYILDHFGYYVPSIRWLTEYGIIKGISNLDLTLGQMSVWHIFQAGFSNFSDPFLRINAILLIFYTIYIVEKKIWIHLCFIPVFLLFSQSPSPDLPVIIFSLIILNEIISGNRNTPLLFGFSIFVFTIKPTMIWLLIVSFCYSVFIVKAQFKHLILGILVLFLFFFKNSWTFGFPVFPVAVGDLGVSWKPNQEILANSAEYAVIKTYDVQYSYKEIQQFLWWDHIKYWLFLPGIKSVINMAFIISLLLFTVYTFIKKNRIITLICISLLIKSIAVLLFSAQYRFFIDVFFIIFFICCRDLFTRKKAIAIFYPLSLFIISFLSFPKFGQQYISSFVMTNFMGPFEKEQLFKPSEYQYEKFNTFRIGNLKFNVSQNYPFSFDTPLPSISPDYIREDVKAGVFPQLVDKKNIRKGFIWKKLNTEEKAETEKIINTIDSLNK